MEIDVSGRRALVTGSTAGIGLETAAVLAECGADVVVNGRHPDTVAQAVADLQQKYPGVRISGAPGDMASAAGISAVIEAAGPVDILINNAAVYGAKDFFEIDDDEWQNYWDVNVMAAVRLCRHYAPLMVASGWGRIVMISSESAVQIHSQMIHYGATKIALVALARGLAHHYPGTGLTVNSVLPGMTRSRGVMDWLESEAKRKDLPVEEIEKRWVAKWRPTSLTRRVAEAREVAALVAFLASPLAASITGSTMRADGGTIPTIP